MIIRDFVMADFETVMEMERICFESPSTNRFVQESIEKGHAWVAVENDKIVANLIGYIKNGAAYINNIAVLPEQRGKGIATALINKFEEYYGAKGKVFWLQVDADNPAQKLYFNLGYRVRWVDDNYYGADKHALCMYKNVRTTCNVDE